VGSHKEFFVTDGEKVKLKGKGLYFVRTTKDKPVKVDIASDDQVLFGEISEHTVTTLNTMINSVYKPMVSSLESNEWGKCESD